MARVHTEPRRAGRLGQLPPWPVPLPVARVRVHACASLCVCLSCVAALADSFGAGYRSQGGTSFDRAAPQPPAYKPPVTAASNLSKNYYYGRDARRADLGVPEVFGNDTAARALPAPAAAAATTTPAPSAHAPTAPGPPVPGRPFEWKHSPVSDYPTRFM
jgi:hypothetical protein